MLKGRESEEGEACRAVGRMESSADDGKGFEAQRSMSQSEGSSCASWPSGLERIMGVAREILSREEEPCKLFAV